MRLRRAALLPNSPRTLMFLGKRRRWEMLALWLMCCLIINHVKRQDSVAIICDERARMLQYQLNATMNNLQALAILVSTFHHSKNPSAAVDQLTFAKYAERTVFGRPAASGVVYGVVVKHAERHQFERQQGWTIKKMHSSTSSKQSPPTPMPGGDAAVAMVREPAEEYAPIIFAQDAYKGIISFDLLSAAEGYLENVLRARESGKPVLTAPLKLLNNRLGVISTHTVYKYEPSSNATPQEHIHAAAIGYLGGIFDIEALVDKLLHQQNISVNVYDTTNGRPLSIYGTNDTGSGMFHVSHVSTLNFGDPSRKHEMHCRFIQSPPLPWMDAVGLLIASCIIVAYEMFVPKTNAENADIAKSQLLPTYGAEVTCASIHSLPSWFCYLIKMVLSDGLFGLLLCILVVGAFDPSFNQSLGIRRADENMVLHKFGWSHGRTLMAVENSDMISVDLRKMTGNNDSSGQHQPRWYSSKYQDGTVKPHQPAHMSHKTMVGLWIAFVSAIVLVLGIAVWLLLWCNRRKRVQQKELELSAGMGPRRFQLCELVAATSNFADENKLGQGGFGPVYKGYLRDQDCHVAIKVLSSQQQSEQGLREFNAEVKVMTQLRHRNIVNLVGWCECDSQQRLLVYELMAQGSLDKHLYGPEEILTWQQRYKIVLGLGSALLYLHRECEKCIVHGDIKPANVMLDVSYNAKLGDFGLARLIEHGEDPRTTQFIAGTLGYIDPDFIANRWPRAESDVYSFGVVLLEIACGKRPASRQPNGAKWSLTGWVSRLYDQGMILDAADQRLNGEFDQQQMERVLVTGLWCAHRDPIQRPSIEQAMDVLRSADADLPVLRAVYDERHIRAMEEQAYGDLTVEDRPVQAVNTSTYFTSKDSAYLLAQE